MDKQRTKQFLKDLDRCFSLENMIEKAEAWKQVLHKDAIMITSGHEENIIGAEAIYQAMKQFYTIPDLVFKWEPQIVDVSDDLSLGYVSGIYERTYTYNDKKYHEIGKYTNVWKKTDKGWKIVLDIGNVTQKETKE